MKKLIISDFFGVVGDECAPVFFRKYFPNVSSEDMTDKYFHPGDRGELSFAKICDNVSRDFNVDMKVLMEEFLNTPKPHKEYIELLKKLKGEGNRVVLLSNACDFIVPSIMKRFGIEDLFDETYISYKIGYTKPKKEAFLYVLEKEGFLPKEAIFIDDRKENVDASISLGMSGVIYRNDEETLAKIEETVKGE